MALSQHDLLRLMESLRTADGIELIRVLAQRILQELIEAEATAHIGAEPGEHTETRTTMRNGHREKVLTTQAGDLDLAIPKVRTGSFFPSLLERRRRIDQALYAVVMEAYVQGVSTRSVDDLVKALGGDTGISKSEVSRICGDLDTELSVFRTRLLDHTRFPYIYLDATYCKARVNHQIVSQAVVIATGITEDGGREVLGLMVGDSETEAFWSEFLRSLRERGLTGVRLVIADHHSGLVKAVRKIMLGAAYQRCRVHFLRNVFAVIPKDAAEMVAATIRTIFAQPTAEAVRAQLDTAADMLGRQFPKVRTTLLEAKADLTAFADFPERHWKKIQSTNPLERVNREIKRRVDVVQIFPNPDALERLTTAVLIEMHDEWIAFPRRYLPEGSMDKIYPAEDQPDTVTPLQGT
ncbi:transposase [Streptomyces noursei ZPM]|uniref:Mutator family transposase n=1 Tax=Streptomyces noursei TaxID=1971 RepID=A0A401QS32_STRNR|nr:IS256 family transposase [Streptomyces noursei]AKA01198.1 transposase [Streptomyces noursei ZPM]AKA08215.1 transposase [Streptomyces noursei ZPM]EOT02655.1 transposase [Streptomyces noursei CCRC 11814]EXU92404.1 transposase [Streptomyces noursei PD-1]UWS76874.1 IS256 family transposase [Streptomyces noursei]